MKYFINCLTSMVLCFSGFCQKELIKNTMIGSWMNTKYYNKIMTKSNIKQLENIWPRIIYIDSLGNFIAENGFEQISKESIKVKSISINRGKLMLKYEYCSIRQLKDSAIELYYSKANTRMRFKKLNNIPVSQFGMQVFFRDFYWKKNTKWKMVKVQNDTSVDIQNVFISPHFILSENKKDTITEYEFGDIDTKIIGNDTCYTIIFFSTKNYMVLRTEVFALKKKNDEIQFYDEKKLRYIFTPIK